MWELACDSAKQSVRWGYDQQFFQTLVNIGQEYTEGTETADDWL